MEFNATVEFNKKEESIISATPEVEDKTKHIKELLAEMYAYVSDSDDSTIQELAEKIKSANTK